MHTDCVEVSLAGFAQMILNGWQSVDDVLVFRNFAIEHPQRVSFGAALAIPA
jgi:hypothetical protein